MPFPVPHATVPMIDLKTGLVTWEWMQYFTQNEAALQSMAFDASIVPTSAGSAKADDAAYIAIQALTRTGRVIVSETPAQFRGNSIPASEPPVRPSRQWSIFALIPDMAANIGNYPAAAFPSAIYFELDTWIFRFSDGSGWTQMDPWDTAYDATTWAGSTKGPTQNAVRDKFEQLAPGLTDGIVNDGAYAAGWNGDTTHAPSRNAVYDKVETLLSKNGVNFGPAAVVSITVVDGQVTAIS